MRFPRASAPRSVRRLLPARLFLAATALLSGCSTMKSVQDTVLGTGGPQPGQAGYVSGFLGGVVADEPQAALAGKTVLSGGGNAADAAIATALTLMVTLPSRAGIGGGGACLAYWPDSKGPNQGKPEAILFPPLAPSTSGGDRPAAVPMMARGLYLLQARYGTRTFESLVGPAEQAARFGVPVSRALAKDIAVVAGPLMADPNARAVFSQNGTPLTEGQTLRQADLGATLGAIQQMGVGDMYQGGLARQIEKASGLIGGPIGFNDLRNALPRLAPPLSGAYGKDQIAYLPPPADGGLGAEAAFDVLAKNPADLQAAAERSLSVVARYRAGGITPEAALAGQGGAAGAAVYPASTSFIVTDRVGDTVACALTMNNLFGTGRVMPGLGILAAASPAAVTPPLLSAAIAYRHDDEQFRAATTGTGQAGASLAAAAALIDTLKSKQPMSTPVPDPGRANVIACSNYLPHDQSSCGWAADPRGSGLAVGAN